MLIHPSARAVVSNLSIPMPIKKYFSNDVWDIDLSNNTNPFVDAFCQYPDIKQDELKKLYLERILSLNATHAQQPQLTLENVLLTVGSMEGIDILLRAFCEPNKDAICLIHPTFSAYEHWGRIHNLEVKNIPLAGENFDTFSIEEIIKAHPKIVWLCNPNNPIGTSLAQGVIEHLCESIDGFVVVDEAYIEFSDQQTSVHMLDTYPNLVILRTFSKAWGLAGIRCGVILADQKIIHTLRYIQLPYGLSSPTQALVFQCLSFPERTFESWERIKRNRRQLRTELLAMQSVEKVFESETNFLMVVLKDSEKVLERLAEQKIKVLDCGTSVPRGIRVSLGTEEENERFLEVVRLVG